MKNCAFRIGLLFIIVLISISCVTGPSQKEIHDSWLGAHKSKLIQSWGPPTRYESDGQGGEILIYERTTVSCAVIYGTYYQRVNVFYSDMFVNQKGIIYFYRYGRR